MGNVRTLGHLAESNQSGSFKDAIQQLRGVTNFGLSSRLLATGTIQITAGTADPGVNTVQAFVDGVAISGIVDWITSDDATAQDLAQSINALGGSHNYVATSATDTVTAMQRTGGAIAGPLAATVAGDVLTTDVDFSGATDAFTEHVSGATFDGTDFHELGFTPSVLRDLTNPSDALLVDLNIFVDGQAWQYWMGDIRADAAAAAIVQGLQVATVVFELVEWLGAQSSFVIKLASDEELLYKARYI